MNPCPDCSRFREESAAAYSEFVISKDELAMTDKRDKSFTAKQRAFEAAQGRLKESRRREEAHREEKHRGYGQDQALPSQRLKELRENIGLNDREKVQRTIFAMGAGYNGWIRLPDEIVEGILTILRDEGLYDSEMAALVLNYFEFESSSMSSRQKKLVQGFLEAHGNRFTHVHSAQVVTELRYGDYLN